MRRPLITASSPWLSDCSGRFGTLLVAGVFAKLLLDIVKLDQSLVKDLPEQRPIAIVKFVTQLVKSLGAQVVGEGGNERPSRMFERTRL